MGTQVRVGIIGTSWWPELMYLPSLASHPDARLAAICGRDQARAGALAEKWRIPAVHSDYRALLARDDLDAVVVATPDDLHCAMTLAAVERGLHVMCEKPMAGTADDARRMFAAAESAGVKHMVLFTWRFMPHVRYLRQLVDQGRVGRVRQMTAHFIADNAIDPAYQWRLDGKRANGVLGDLGSHLVDLFRHFVGDVTSVSADLQQIVDRSGSPGPPSAPVNDCAFVTLRTADGAQGMLHVSAASPSGGRQARLGFALHGDAGVLEAEHVFDGAEKVVRLRGTGPGMPLFEPLEVPAALLDGAAVDDIMGPFTRHSAGPRHFIDAIRDDLPIAMSFREGWRTQQVIDAALRSDRERRWIDVADQPLSPP